MDLDRMRIREESIDNIRNFIDNINFNLLEDMERTCNHAIFMEILLNAIKNDTISYQSTVLRAKKDNINDLIKTLATEKTSLTPNIDKITNLETVLNNYWDNEMTREIESYSLFEHVNMEKMTPHFLKLAKNTQPDNKISDIKKDDNSDFISEQEQKEFIVQYYENLYKLPATATNNLDGCIEEFLGPTIMNSPLVKNMKIGRELARSLEADISILELDNALDDTRTQTAAGPDGIIIAL